MRRNDRGKSGQAMRRQVAVAAALLAGAMPGLAWAQQTRADPGTFRLDPSRDPARPESVQRQGPDVAPQAQPTVQTPPPTASPPPASAAPAETVPTSAPPPAVVRTVRPEPTATPRRQESATPPPVRTQADATRADEAPTTEPALSAIVPATDNAASTAPQVETLPVEIRTPPASRSPVALIVAGVAAVLALLGWILLRRRRDGTADIVHDDAPAIDVATPDESAVLDSASAPTPDPTPATRVVRPVIDMTLEAQAARLSLLGATVGYRITLRNDGKVAARDIAIRLNMANADAQRREALAQFFALPEGEPAHRIASLQPGEEQVLTGEYMLREGTYKPFQAGDRLLLIPILACDARYAWGEDAVAQTGGAWVVGCEHEPPDAKLAAFRLDQGPRMFAQVGCRRMETAFAT